MKRVPGMKVWRKINLLKAFQNIPLHVILLGSYPILAMLSANINEVDTRAANRLFLIGICASLLLFSFFVFIFRNIHKAGITTSIAMVLFLSYGQIYQALRSSLGGVVGMSIARHRILLPVCLLLLGCIYWIILRRKNLQSVTLAMNIIGSGLIIFNLLPILSHAFIIYQEKVIRAQNSPARLVLNKPLKEMPDIYYIILDSYTRADVLKQDFDLDTTPFLNQMKEMGFYVADCSTSNYAFTEVSMASSLNMNYLNELRSDLNPDNKDLTLATALIQNNEVRQQLEAIGYKTVAFETGYAWNHWTDADLFLSPTESYRLGAKLQPFEVMFIESTALTIVSDFHPNWLTGEKASGRHTVTIERARFILDKLPNLPDLGGPKFVYAHINVPHVPFVFKADGAIWDDPNFYNGVRDYPKNEEYFLEGYRQQVEFLNNRIPDIVETIIRNSKIPPVIIIQGDHGIRDDNRMKILNLYHIPEEEGLLYSSITPVNTFRVVFNDLFTTDYPLLADRSYFSVSEDPYNFEEVFDSTCLANGQ